MITVEPSQVRNFALVGHGKSGKTSLAEAFLFDSGAVNRLGKVDEGSSNLDTEPEELKRHASIHTKVGACAWRKHKVNFVDTPGDASFVADATLGTSAADGAIVVVSAPDGVQVGTERAWLMAQEMNLPAAVFINKLDRERAEFDKAVSQIRKLLTAKAIPLQLPIGREQSFNGVVDLLTLKAHYFDDQGRRVSTKDLPEDLLEEATRSREQLIEAIAAADDALLEKYLETMELSEAETRQGLAAGVRTGALVPILCGAATRNLGVQPMLDLVVAAFPSPLGREPYVGCQAGKRVARTAATDEPFSGIVLKTISADVGRLAIVRVVSGTLHADATVANPSRGCKERVGQLYCLTGRKRETVERGVAGDFIGLAKLKETKTGDSLCDDGASVEYPRPAIPEPLIAYAVTPKAKTDEERVANKLHDILEEDVALKLDREPTTHEMLLHGLGQTHIDITVEKLRRMGVEVELSEPKVPYRETIRGKVTEVEGKHKKQSGGRGQYGVCIIDMESRVQEGTDEEDPLEFVNAIFGGSIPKQFIPAVEKGIRDRMTRGVVAGFPVVGIKVTLKDGKYHPVDSDGRSFEMAGSKAFQEAFKRAKPVLLEPVMHLEIRCPEESLGDIFGDISSRRGRVAGTEAEGRNQLIRAQAPLAEILRYAIDLESMTAGRGCYSMSFSHYDEVPPNLSEKIIADARVAADED